MFATPRLVTHSFNWQCKRVIGDNLFGIQHSGRRAYTSTLNVKEKDQLHTGDRYASIPDRSLLEIQGPDTAKFLQGLITNNMPLIAQGGDGFFTSILTPQVCYALHSLCHWQLTCANVYRDACYMMLLSTLSMMAKSFLNPSL